MGRIIIYGDIHGCLEELKELRRTLQVTSADLEISVGDLLSKGPHPVQTLRYARKNGILTVLGNHEERYLEIAAAHKHRPGVTLHRASQKHYEKLDTADLAYLFAMPRFIKISNLTVVHAGLTNTIDLDRLQDGEDALLTRLRYVSRGMGSYEYVFWAEIYNGTQGFVVYGHTPQGITRHPYALGIDTGCVYGEKLTAAVFERQGVQVDTQNPQLVQVKAKDRYA
jgi:diadenosine tetraphosphatase ApaH/serine/threonine PP2A family protein phosphatase